MLMRSRLASIGRLQRLAIFESAARLGSFTAASAELAMSQPAVTRQVRLLERSLGLSLFVRSANRSELSADGHALFRELTTAFDGIERGLTDLQARNDVFVLACNPGFAQQWLVPRLGQLQAALGPIELRLWLFNRDTELSNGAYDAAVRVGDGAFPGVRAVHLFAESVFPVASPQLGAALGLGPHSDAETLLVSGPLLHMDDGDRPWMSWAQWFDHFGLGLESERGRILYNNYPVVLQEATAGRGIALGWRHLVDPLVRDGLLVAVGREVASRSGYFLTWKDGSDSPVTRAFSEWLVAQVGA